MERSNEYHVSICSPESGAVVVIRSPQTTWASSQNYAYINIMHVRPFLVDIMFEKTNVQMTTEKQHCNSLYPADDGSLEHDFATALLNATLTRWTVVEVNSSYHLSNVVQWKIEYAMLSWMKSIGFLHTKLVVIRPK